MSGFLTLGFLMAGPPEDSAEKHSTDQPITKPQATTDFHHLLMAGPLEDPVEKHSTDQPITKPQATTDFHHSVNDSLQIHTTNCTNPYLSLTTSTLDDKGKLLTFTSKGHHDVEARTSETCRVYLTSHSPDVIWAVLLEHSRCGGGVFVLLWEGTKHRQWDVCSFWHSPGPDMMTSSNGADVRIELNDVIDPCVFTLYVRAVDRIPEGELELHYLAAMQGPYIFLF